MMASALSSTWAKVACAALAFTSTARAAITLDINDPNSLKVGAKTVALDMMSMYSGNQSGQTPGLLPGEGQPNGYYWWEGGAMFGGLIYYWYYTGDSSFNDAVTQALLFQRGEYDNFEPRNQTFDLGNDDQAFWAFSAMAAAEFNYPDPPKGMPSWLALAQAVFNRQQPRWDPATCNGGLRWQFNQFNQGYDYKNSIANGCFMLLASRLGKYTGNQTYIDWAAKAWDWTKAIGLIDNNYYVYDGTSVEQNCTQFNHYQWTYNAGVFLYSTAVLWNVTGDDMWRTECQNMIGGLKIFLPNGGQVMSEVACEPAGNCNTDSQSYKAYLARWIADTIKVAPWTRDQLLPILQASAQAAVKTCTGGANGDFCGLSWVKGAFNGNPGIGEQLAVMEVIQSNLLDTVGGPLTAKTGGRSSSDPTAGAGTDGGDASMGGSSQGLSPITTSDKAGAGILTIITAVGVVGMFIWMTL